MALYVKIASVEVKIRRKKKEHDDSVTLYHTGLLIPQQNVVSNILSEDFRYIVR